MIARFFKRLDVRIALGLILTSSLAWILWTETQPEQERWLRVQAQERLIEWFPEAMQASAGELGFVPRPTAPTTSPLVIMIHGLDEPGGIFEELALELDQAGFAHTEFRYPNDQAIPQSAELLAAQWSSLPSDLDVILIGHSMGGLVIRSFVTRALSDLPETRAQVIAALLIGTPNRGSEWARLRVWLEIRDRLGPNETDDYSLFAGLRDGTGAAKIDLRPGSEFLQTLNASPWPDDVGLAILGGQIASSASVYEDERRNKNSNGLNALADEINDPDWSQRFARWLDSNAQQLGDGVVSVSALAVPGGPEPDIVDASHRGLLVSGPFNEQAPPGIAWTLQKLAEVADNQ